VFSKVLPNMQSRCSEIRNLALEHIARRQKYPCANRQSGCHDWFSIEHIAYHFVVCIYENIKCPFQILNTCSWNGIKSDLNEHANSAHPRCFFYSSTLTSLYMSETLAILSCFIELFTYYQLIQNGRFYDAVQAFGKSSVVSKYKRNLPSVLQMMLNCMHTGHSSFINFF